MTRLMDGPTTTFVGEKSEEFTGSDKADLTGFMILQDLRIIDLRKWQQVDEGTLDPGSHVYGYRRLKVLKEPGSSNNNFRISVLAISPDTQVRFPAQQLQPKLYSRNLTDRMSREPLPRDNLRYWAVGADFSKLPAGESVDIMYEHSSPGLFLHGGLNSTSLAFDV